MSDVFTLASLLAGRFSIEWYEAVALVREVSERLPVDSGSSVLVPELNQIHLSTEGHVDVVGGIHTDEPVRRLGQLLLALIANSEAPVQLRLVISQATAPTPVYGSIREYSEAIAFFERPERSRVLQTLAARAATTSTVETSDRQLTLDSLAPLPSRSGAEEPRKHVPSPSRARAWRFAAAAAVVVGVCAGAAWYAWSRGIGPHSRSDVTSLADRASEAVGGALISGASAVTERLGLGRIVPAESAAPPAPPVPPATLPKPPQQKRPAGAAPADPVTPLLAFDLEPSAGGDGSSGAAVPTATPKTEPAPTERRAEDPTIYTTGSEGVTPPVGVRPKLARQLPPDMDRDHLGRIELVIASDGSVESAKLLGPPRTVHDGLFLSVVKAWSFQPALKDGFPVRYRKTIWIASP